MNSRMLDIITGAVKQYKVYGRSGIDDAFRAMTQQDRLAFDLGLVAGKDVLAWQAGTTESRFRARVLAMALNRPAVNERGLMDLSEPAGLASADKGAR